MKISKRVRDLHSKNHEKQLFLKNFVDEIASDIQRNNPSWHYISRLKSEESFALKLETGRGYIAKQETIEDFFACTFVVENYAAIRRAYEVIQDYFNIRYQRPQKDSITHKSPENFPFDDLRLYCKVKTKSENIFKDIVFEIQIKTFLQHAWGIATHDLIYKGDQISWGTHRIAFQIKAMLEHAELSIQQAEQLANCNALNKTTSEFSEKIAINEIISRHWQEQSLPTDKKRLISNFHNLLKILGENNDFLDTVLNSGLKENAHHPSNLSPYSTFIQYLIFYCSELLENFTRKEKPIGKIFLDPNLDIPNDLDLTSGTHYIFL